MSDPSGGPYGPPPAAPPPPPWPPAPQPPTPQPPFGAPGPAGPWPPSPPGQAAPGVPPAGPPPRRHALLLTAVAVSFVMLLVAAGVAAWVTFFRDDGPSHPDEWDPRVADIAQFVQTERGILFEHPVHVDFLTEEEFVAQVTRADDELSDEDREALEHAEAALRAMGLVEGDVDLFEKQNQLTGEGAAAFYDPDTERITVRGTELNADVRGTIAHEMTHALQDQYIDIEAVEEELDDDQRSLFRAVVEGDASRVEDAYVADELSANERRDYEQRSREAAEGVDLEGVPPALVAFFQAPYALGPSFVAIIESEDGNSGINDALRSPPASDRQLLDPRLFLDGTRPDAVEPPALPDGAQVVEDGEFGALSWYVVLASRLDPKAAIDVVDDWAGDSYATYEEEGRVCVSARYRATDPAGAGRVRALFEDWIEAMGGGSARLADLDERTLELVSCDPGPEATSPTASSPEKLLAVPAGRLAIAAELVERVAVPLEGAWCAADAVVDALTVDELTSSEVSPDAQQRVVRAMATCGLRPG